MPTRIEKCISDFMSLAVNSDFLWYEITSHKREKPLVDERKRIANQLRYYGYSYPEIGEAMNRDHSSVIHMVRNAVT